jgi:hypothetical protein
MATFPTRVTAAGNEPKWIDELIARVDSDDEPRLNIAPMQSQETVHRDG